MCIGQSCEVTLILTNIKLKLLCPQWSRRPLVLDAPGCEDSTGVFQRLVFLGNPITAAAHAEGRSDAQRATPQHPHMVPAPHLHQGRFKTFPIAEDQHLLAVLRYVERNALRANLCERAEGWKYGSLWRRTSGNEESCEMLSEWSIPQSRTWVAMVNRVQNESHEKAIRKCLKKAWYCPKIFWGEKVLFSFRPLAGWSGRNARFGINTTS